MQAKDTSLVIVGAGGHGCVVVDAALCTGAWMRVSVTENVRTPIPGDYFPGVERVAYAELAGNGAQVHIAIGDAVARERESHAWKARLATIVHPHATVSRFADLAEGTFVAAQAVVGPRAKLGFSVIVNHGAVVDHDCAVGACSHIAPGATLGGAASAGARVLVGAGARLLPRVSVCDDVIIGAGAVVTESITVPGVYAGVPARRVR